MRGRDGGQGLPQEGLRGVRVARGEGETTDRGDRGGERTRRRLRSAEARVAVFVGRRHGERGGIAPLGGGGGGWVEWEECETCCSKCLRHVEFRWRELAQVQESFLGFMP